jgi:hypothetical protein
MSKSAKWRERQRAYEAGRLHEWHAAREVTPPTPPANPFDNYEAISTPVGMVWREDERWPTWSLPTQVASPRGRY